MRTFRLNLVGCLACVSMIANSTPAFADDSTTTGLIAGLGVTAATGKLSLGDSSGAIEAELYGAEGFQQAGSIIASIVNSARRSNSNRPVLVIAHGDTLDLISDSTIANQIALVDGYVKATCPTKAEYELLQKAAEAKQRAAEARRRAAVARLAAAKAAAAKLAADLRRSLQQSAANKTGKSATQTFDLQSQSFKALQLQQSIKNIPADTAPSGAGPETPTPTGGDATAATTKAKNPLTPSAADIGSAAAVDTSINGISISSDDRMIVNALLMNASYPAWTGAADYTGWRVWPGIQKTYDALNPDYWAPAEEVGIPDPKSGIYAAYQNLLADTYARRAYCPKDPGKSAIASADALVTALGASDKGPAPITLAIANEWFTKKNPLVLRVAVEQSGGTALARNGLLYTFGWPNAATVSAGLLVSFRLVDPRGGGVLALGIVRCISRQANLKKVADYLQHQQHRPSAEYPTKAAETVCDFKVAMPRQRDGATG